MPVAYCSNQFKNWLLPKFLPVLRKGKNAKRVPSGVLNKGGI